MAPGQSGRLPHPRAMFLVDRLRAGGCGWPPAALSYPLPDRLTRSRRTRSVPSLADAYDGGKKINGRKPRLPVDTVGLVLTVIVTAAPMRDRDGAFRLLAVLARAVCLRSPWRDRRRILRSWLGPAQCWP